MESSFLEEGPSFLRWAMDVERGEGGKAIRSSLLMGGAFLP